MTQPSVEPLLGLNDSDLEWKRFERFCLDFAKALPDVRDAHLYGVRGEEQQGIDIHVDLADGRVRTVQCRRVVRFGKPQAEKTIRETTYKADEHQIWATCQLSAAARKLVARRRKWTAWDIEQLSSELRRLPREEARWIVEDHLGPAERRRVLGPTGELVVAPARRWFARSDGGSRALQTNQPLVGRGDELAALVDAVRNPDVVCVLVVGRGGIGKTRMLRAFAETQSDRRIVVLREGVDVTAELAAQLPMAHFDLVVDDAHRRTDLRAVLATTLTREELQTIVLATRPHRVQAVNEQLVQLGIPLAAVRILDPLAPLPIEAATQLAEGQLDDVNRPHGARLAELTRDAPAILVLAANLIADGEVDAETLIASPVLRRQVLASYHEERLGQLDPAIEPSVASRLLALIAAVQPVDTAAPKMLPWLADQLADDQATMRQAVDALVGAGLLQGSTHRRRVAPDILGDHLVHEQCVDRDGNPTGRPTELVEAVPLELLGHLLGNLAELDWRLGRAGEPQILDEACRFLKQRLRNADAWMRQRYLEQVAPSGAFLASWAIELARELLDHPAADTTLLADHVVSDADARTELVSLLENAGLDPACTEAAIRLLWEIGADTEPRPSKHGGDALDAARRLGGYRRPLSYAEALLTAVEQLVRDPRQAEVRRHLPVELLRGLIQREGTTSEMASPRAIRLGSYAVDARRTADVRSRLRALLVDLSLNGGDRTRPAAASILGDMLRQPHGYYGRPVPHEQLRQWRPEQLAIVADISRIFETTSDALVAWTLRDAISWHAERSALHGVKTAVRRVLKRHPATTEERVLDALTTGIARFADRDRLDRERAKLARELRAEYPGTRSLMDWLDRAMERLVRCRPGQQANVGPLLIALADDDDWALDAVQLLMNEPERPTAPGISILLGAVLSGGSAPAPDLLRSTATAANPTLRRTAADYISRMSWVGDPDARERALAVLLAADEDPAVVQLVLLAALRCADDDPALAASILLAIRDLSVPQLAEDACMVLTHKLPLTEQEWQRLLDNLLACPRIEYWYDRVLVERATVHWRQILDHLLTRVYERQEDYSYDALPFDGFSGNLLATDSQERRATLDEVLANLIQRPEGRASMELPVLFWSVAGADSEPLSVIAHALAGDEHRRAAACLLISGGGRHRFLDAPAWVAQQLESSPPGEPLDELRGALAGALHSGIKQGTPGEPFPEDVELEGTARQHATQSPAGSRTHEFWTRIAASAAAEMQRAVEEDDLD